MGETDRCVTVSPQLLRNKNCPKYVDRDPQFNSIACIINKIRQFQALHVVALRVKKKCVATQFGNFSQSESLIQENSAI
jgi:hypothetical protein